MEENLHQLRLVVYPITYKVLYIPNGGCFKRWYIYVKGRMEVPPPCCACPSLADWSCQDDDICFADLYSLHQAELLVPPTGPVGLARYDENSHRFFFTFDAGVFSAQRRLTWTYPWTTIFLKIGVGNEHQYKFQVCLSLSDSRRISDLYSFFLETSLYQMQCEMVWEVEDCLMQCFNISYSYIYSYCNIFGNCHMRRW